MIRIRSAADRLGREIRYGLRAWRRESTHLVVLLVVLGGGAGLVGGAATLVTAGLRHPAPVESPLGLEIPLDRVTLEQGVPASSLTRQPVTEGRPWLGRLQPDQAIADMQAEGVRVLLLSLAAAVGLILLVTCTNAGLLLVARHGSRESNLVLRRMLGASGWRTASHLLLTHLPLLLFAGTVAAAVMTLAIGSGVATSPESLAAWSFADAGDVGGALFALPLLIATLIALLPALRWPTAAPGSPQAGARSTADRLSRGRRERLTRFGFASATALLLVTGLLVRGFPTWSTPQSIGYDPADTVTFTVRPEPGMDPASRAQSISSLVSTVSGLAGVESASVASEGTWLGLGSAGYVHAVIGQPGVFGRTGVARYSSVSPEALGAAGVNFLHGRDFTDGDAAGSMAVAIINRTFAGRLFEMSNPVGRVVQLGAVRVDAPTFRVIGVIDDIHPPGLGNEAAVQPALYFSALQVPPPTFDLAVRHRTDPATAAETVAAALRAESTWGEITYGGTLEEVLIRFAAPIRWFGLQFAYLAGFCALLAALGLFGLINYNARQRIREVGVRLALGATPRSIIRLLVGEGLRIGAGGALLGIAAAICIARAIQFRIAGMALVDPIAYTGVLLVIATVVLTAAYLPARAAAALDPAEALRHD